MVAMVDTKNQERPAYRLVWADLVRVYATFAVVMLHAASVPVMRFDSQPISQWLWADAYRSVTASCIPLFVMLSGALVLGTRSVDTKAFAEKRIRKVLIPLVAWSLIYFAWARYFHSQPITLGQFGTQLLSGIHTPVYVHLWFMYLIISLYLLVPIFSVYVQNASLKNQLYFAALWILGTAVFPSVEQATGIVVDINLQPVAGFIGYFVLGATIICYCPAVLSRKWIAVCLVVMISGLVATFWGTYLETVAQGGKLYESLFGHLAPNVDLIAIPTFLLLRHYGTTRASAFERNGVAGALAIVGSLSFGVYLIHVIIMELLESGSLGFALGRTQFPSAYCVPLVALTVFSLSVAATALLRRLKWLDWLVP